MYPEQRRAALLNEYISSLSPQARAKLQQQYDDAGGTYIRDPQAKLIQSSLREVNRNGQTTGRRQLAASRVFFDTLSKYFSTNNEHFDFEGEINRDTLADIWRWISRDAAPRQVERLNKICAKGGDVTKAVAATKSAVSAYAQSLFARMDADPNIAQRERIQLGGEDNAVAIRRLALLLEKETVLDEIQALVPFLTRPDAEAQISTFFRAAALLSDQLRAFLMLATVRQLDDPIVLVAAAVKSIGRKKETALRRAGLGPVLDAILADADEQVAQIRASRGVFADADLMCNCLNRFVKYVRAVSAHVEVKPRGEVAHQFGRQKSDINAKLQDPLDQLFHNIQLIVTPSNSSPDRVNKEAVLLSLSGMHVLATTHRYKDTLAMNKICDKVWEATGIQVEANANRSLDKYRAADPENDSIELERLDAMIKVAVIRFDDDYPEILRRARNHAQQKRHELHETEIDQAFEREIDQA